MTMLGRLLFLILGGLIVALAALAAAHVG